MDFSGISLQNWNGKTPNIPKTSLKSIGTSPRLNGSTPVFTFLAYISSKQGAASEPKNFQKSTFWEENFLKNPMV